MANLGELVINDSTPHTYDGDGDNTRGLWYNGTQVTSLTYNGTSVYRLNYHFTPVFAVESNTSLYINNYRRAEITVKLSKNTNNYNTTTSTKTVSSYGSGICSGVHAYGDSSSYIITLPSYSAITLSTNTKSLVVYNSTGSSAIKTISLTKNMVTAPSYSYKCFFYAPPTVKTSSAGTSSVTMQVTNNAAVAITFYYCANTSSIFASKNIAANATTTVTYGWMDGSYPHPMKYYYQPSTTSTYGITGLGTANYYDKAL